MEKSTDQRPQEDIERQAMKDAEAVADTFWLRTTAEWSLEYHGAHEAILRDRLKSQEREKKVQELIGAGKAMRTTNICHSGGDYAIANCCKACTASLAWDTALHALTTPPSDEHQ